MLRICSTVVCVCGLIGLVYPSARAAEARGAQLAAQSAARGTRVTGVIRDEQNALSLPGVTVSVVATGETVVTDVDGRYSLQLPPGRHQVKVVMDGYKERTLDVAVAETALTVDVALRMNEFAEEITVTGQIVDAASSTQEAQLVERRSAQVITDNM